MDSRPFWVKRRPTSSLTASMASPPPTTQSPEPETQRLKTGGTPENKWSYDQVTGEFHKEWKTSYYATHFDGERVRAVRWYLHDLTQVGDKVTEVWKWEYVGLH